MVHQTGFVEFALGTGRSDRWYLRRMRIGTDTRGQRGAPGARVVRNRLPPWCAALGGFRPTRIAGQ